jgi:hypothetical protein
LSALLGREKDVQPAPSLDLLEGAQVDEAEEPVPLVEAHVVNDLLELGGVVTEADLHSIRNAFGKVGQDLGRDFTV